MKVQRSKFKVQNLAKSLKLLTFHLTLIFALCTLNLHVRQAYAQSLSLSISPPILEVFIKPGKSITQTYKLINEGETVIIVPRLLELTESGIKEDENFVPDPWITLLNTDLAFGRPFLLPTNTLKQIILKVSPSHNLEEKDYLRALVFSTRPNPAGETSQSQLSQNLATPLLITVTSTGLFPKGALITKFDLPSFIDSFGPVELDIEVKNTGKTYFHPNGKITLTSPIGKGDFPIIPQVIFAGQTKKILTEDLSLTKNGTKTLELAGFFLGKYNIKVEFTLDQGTTTISQEKTFYALPYKASGVFLLIMILFYMLRKIKLHKRKQR